VWVWEARVGWLGLGAIFARAICVENSVMGRFAGAYSEKERRLCFIYIQSSSRDARRRAHLSLLNFLMMILLINTPL